MTNAKIPSFFPDVNTSKKLLALLGWDKIHAQDPSGKIGCVARMEYNQKIYWAVNGAPSDVNNPADNAEKIDILESVLINYCKNAIIVHLDTTKTNINLTEKIIDPKIYFPHAKKTVLLTQYQAACKNSSPPQDKIEVRHFSCCERKLIEAVSNPQKDSFKIDVLKPPCELCLAAKEYLNNPNFQLNYANWWLVKAYDELHHLGLV